MTRSILIHHHIFKNAGTSFNHALEQCFQARFLEYDLPEGRVVTADRLEQLILEQPQALAISGHHIAMPAPQGEHYQTLSSVLLRRPLARVRSIYEFEKRQQTQAEQGAIMAKTLSFRDYVQWRLDVAPATLSNYQTQYCARVGDWGADYSATEKDLATAIQNLKNCAIVGTVERYDEFLTLAQLRLSPIYPDIALTAAHLNATAENAPDASPSAYQTLKAALANDLGQDLLSLLERSNQLDETLYQAACEILTEQLACCAAENATRLMQNERCSATLTKRLEDASFPGFLRSLLNL